MSALGHLLRKEVAFLFVHGKQRITFPFHVHQDAYIFEYITIIAQQRAEIKVFEDLYENYACTRLRSVVIRLKPYATFRHEVSIQGVHSSHLVRAVKVIAEEEAHYTGII